MAEADRKELTTCSDEEIRSTIIDHLTKGTTPPAWRLQDFTDELRHRQHKEIADEVKRAAQQQAKAARVIMWATVVNALALLYQVFCVSGGS